MVYIVKLINHNKKIICWNNLLSYWLAHQVEYEFMRKKPICQFSKKDPSKYQHFKSIINDIQHSLKTDFIKNEHGKKPKYCVEKALFGLLDTKHRKYILEYCKRSLFYGSRQNDAKNKKEKNLEKNLTCPYEARNFTPSTSSAIS